MTPRPFLSKLAPLTLMKINRLVVFQNMCLLSATSHAHTLNKWMIRFLIEHALPLDGNASDFSTGTSQIISTETQKFTEQGRFTTFPLSEFPV